MVCNKPNEAKLAFELPVIDDGGTCSDSFVVIPEAPQCAQVLIPSML